MNSESLSHKYSFLFLDDCGPQCQTKQNNKRNPVFQQPKKIPNHLSPFQKTHRYFFSEKEKENGRRKSKKEEVEGFSQDTKRIRKQIGEGEEEEEEEEEQWKARILVNSGFSSIVTRLNPMTSKLIFFNQERLSEEELLLPFDGALYLPPEGICDFSTEEHDEEGEKFENFVCLMNGIEKKCLLIWVYEDDWEMEDTMAEKLRLEERNCEWRWEYDEDDEALYPRLLQFFEDHTQLKYLKPAKR